MREYGRIYPSFWTGETGKIMRNYGSDCQITAVYLLSCPHANMIGLYYLPTAYMSNDIGMKDCAAQKALSDLELVGFSEYDHSTEFVWVYEMGFYQVAKTLKPNDKQVAGINKLYNSLSENPFLYRFWEKYHDAFHIEKARGTEAPSKTLLRPFEAMQCNASNNRP